MFLLAIFHFFYHGFKHDCEHGFEDGLEHSLEHCFEHGFEHDLNMALNTNSSQITILFQRSNAFASVSILPDFSRLILDFSLRSSFIRVNVSNSNKISEYSSSEIESSYNAFDMRLLTVLTAQTAIVAICSCFTIFNDSFLMARFPTSK